MANDRHRAIFKSKYRTALILSKKKRLSKQKLQEIFGGGE